MKKFFKLFVFFIYSFCSAQDLTVKLEFTGLQDSKAYVGENFGVKVIVTSSEKDIGDVHVQGLGQLKVLGSSQATSISRYNSNFLSEKSYMYDVVADKVGIFKIGPAQVTYNNQVINSVPELLTLQVMKRKEGSPVSGFVGPQASGIPSYEVFCKLEVESKNVVVGQPIVLNLKIYHRGNIAQLGLEPLKFVGFISKEIEQVARKAETVDGKPYSVLEKKFLLLPVEEGKREIDPVVINFNVPVKRKRGHGWSFEDDFFGNLPVMFGENFEPKRAISNGLKIDVSSLPKYNDIVDGVGDFSSFDVTVDRTEALVNEPVLLKFQIEGRGNLDQIVVPKLSLPEGFRFYESKTDLQQDLSKDFRGGKKSFEFVLQVNKVGQYKIPEQKFVYFDVKSKKYKTLRSKAISLDIKSPPEGISYTDTKNVSDALGAQEQDVSEYKQDIHFIEEENITKVRNKGKKSLPLVLFLILLLVPLIFYFKRLFNPIICWFKSRSNIKQSSSKLKKELDKIIEKKEVKKLYKFFLSYLSVKFNVKLSGINQDWIEARLLELGLKQDKVDDFLSYLNDCASLSFAANSSGVDTEKLLSKSSYWLVYLDSGKG